MSDVPDWAGRCSENFLPEIVVSPTLRKQGLSLSKESFSRKTSVKGTYPKVLAITTEEPEKGETIINIMKKFHS